MVKSKRLEPIRKLAQNQEKKAARQLGVSLENQKHEAQKLQQLEQYRREYIEAMEDKIKQGVSGATLQHFHQFLNKLQAAITQQKEVIKQAQKRVERHQGQWQDDHNRTKVISQVMTQIQKREVIQRNKHETRQSDEISTQAFIRRQNAKNAN